MPDTATEQIANAFVMFELGEVDRGTDSLERLLKALPTAAGDAEHAAVVSIATLCKELGNSGRPVRVSLLRELCAAAARNLETERIVSLSSRLMLASALVAQREFKEVEAIASDILDRSEQALGKDHPLTMNCAMVLSFSNTGDVDSGHALLARIPGLRQMLLSSLKSGGA